ncbi:CDP-diacylglycerol--glycerol-3-phosphate 3-phosphatidyltransferase [Maricaulis sp. W15]|uniref:CDP-diacylglycerol--glycerol-3-phosphate 3-phosphatidyltransferase n=1 Tax=Maricaulis sp. W15 TaxID=1772333 RepID=UPI000948F042|nr:CDP-diacylglycerol--glycerol-3-phosphate 3-phosphatidyltransferase [Maricaulis sp. W15]
MMTWPNLLTASRIALVPFLFLALSMDSTTGLVFALALAITAEVTDMLDGWVARRFNQQSDFGAQFDPLADSLYRIGAFTALAAGGLIPVWTIIVFAWRDVLVSYARLMMQSKGRAVGARLSGKLKAIVQGVAIIALLAVPLVPASLVDPALVASLAQASFWLAVAVTVWSCVDYLLAGLRAGPDKA